MNPRKRPHDEIALERAVAAVRRAYRERYPVDPAGGPRLIAAIIAALNAEFRGRPSLLPPGEGSAKRRMREGSPTS